MSDFKEFQAKTLDQAIQDACQYFGTERVKLEVEILEDAKSGIFGLVGARKARVNARLAQLSTAAFMPQKSDEPKAKKTTTSTKTASKTTKTKSAPVKVEVTEHVEITESVEHVEHIEITERVEVEDVQTSKPRPQSKSTRSHEKRGVAKHDKPNDRFNRQKGFEEEDEEDESQRKFLSKIIPHGEEELDESVLAALDREAMARANMLGNMTEAEIRATGQNQSSDRRTRGRESFRERNDRGGQSRDRNDKTRSQVRERNDKDRSQVRERNDRGGQSRDRNDRERSQVRDDKRTGGTYAPHSNASKNLTSEEALERRNFYEQKRMEQREARPPKPAIIEYDTPALPRVPLLELDTEKLLTITRETILALVGPIVGFEVPIEVKIADDRVLISIESEDTGLLIGREGQHLAAIQYIASRILTRKMESQIRIQVDTGDYHSRQDSRMEFLAHALADKVKVSGRPQSTRPLSAYQRRVIHVALQEETEIQTRSCGEGTLKRVIIMRRRNPVNKSTENEGAVSEESFISEPDLNSEAFVEMNEETSSHANRADNAIVDNSMESEPK